MRAKLMELGARPVTNGNCTALYLFAHKLLAHLEAAEKELGDLRGSLNSMRTSRDAFAKDARAGIYNLKFHRDAFALVWPLPPKPKTITLEFRWKPEPARVPSNYEPMSHDGKPASMRSIRKRRRSEFGIGMCAKPTWQVQEEINKMPFFTLRNPLR